MGDVVLANVHFARGTRHGSRPGAKLGWRVDRLRLRDVMNEQCRTFVASYEPLVHDVSVSIKHFEDTPLPHTQGSAPWRWSLVLTGRCSRCGPSHGWPPPTATQAQSNGGWYGPLDHRARPGGIPGGSPCPLPGHDAPRAPLHHQATATLSHARVCVSRSPVPRFGCSPRDPWSRWAAGRAACAPCTSTSWTTCRPSAPRSWTGAPPRRGSPPPSSTRSTNGPSPRCGGRGGASHLRPAPSRGGNGGPSHTDMAPTPTFRINNKSMLHLVPVQGPGPMAKVPQWQDEAITMESRPLLFLEWIHRGGTWISPRPREQGARVRSPPRKRQHADDAPSPAAGVPATAWPAPDDGCPGRRRRGV